jgi:hypothetical protein
MAAILSPASSVRDLENSIYLVKTRFLSPGEPRKQNVEFSTKMKPDPSFRKAHISSQNSLWSDKEIQ